ncbi:MAG TPA: M50 family metallopeptidase, partial [Kofleriaceae bacterium]|nr:M50 family metallopeptidase [Kofleriaceae bacterium]
MDGGLSSSLKSGRAARRAATDPVETARRARWVFALSAGVTLLLYLVPFLQVIGRPLIYISTLVHELGHGIGAILVGGDFLELEMWADGSGVAHSTARSATGHAFICAAGLVGPAVAAGGGGGG